MSRVDYIKETISTIPFIKKIYKCEEENSIIYGKVQVALEDLDIPLDFTFQINPQYPLKHHESESISFYNKDLIELNHVMESGSICIHTSHHTNLKQKILIDFDSLKQWIKKYYINKDNDLKYEHIVVEEYLLNDSYYSYIFTDVDYTFTKGEFGEVEISPLLDTTYKNKHMQNHIITGFRNSYKSIINCMWSQDYQNSDKAYLGLFYFMKEAPVKHNRFILKDWNDFSKLLSIDFLNYLHNYEKRNIAKYKNTVIPIFIGYKTIDIEVHWQVALIEIGSFPIEGVAEKVLGIKTGKWNTHLIKSDIKWALTRNSSYKYFFGRGSLNKDITDKKILIIGLGAIGSMLAKTLTNTGCKYIDIADYDIKEPENVCRSEYQFQFGLGDKVMEMKRILTAISPFIEIEIFKNEYFESMIKTFHKDKEIKKIFTSSLNQYDIIFDCTTDNDLMYILDNLKLNCTVINISMTNHAQALVCAFYPNIYHFVSAQFQDVLENDLVNLYEPTGCWSPTFKASYNDINLLVQLAIKHINNLFRYGNQKNNFIIQDNVEKSLGLKVIEY